MNDIEIFKLEEEDIYNKEYKNKQLDNLTILNKNIYRNTFDNCNFNNSNYQNVFFEKNIFKNCDFSNSKFIDCNFKEVEFQHCKMVGTIINNTHISKSNFTNTIGKYLNLIDIKTKEIIIKECNFKESTFYNVLLNKASLNKVDFSKSEFINTSLFGIDFSNCNIENIKITDKLLKGIKVNSFQAIELAKLLGIEIVE